PQAVRSADLLDLPRDAVYPFQGGLSQLAVEWLDVDVQLIERAFLAGPPDDGHLLDLLPGLDCAAGVYLALDPVGVARAVLDELVQRPAAHQLVVHDHEQHAVKEVGGAPRDGLRPEAEGHLRDVPAGSGSVRPVE